MSASDDIVVERPLSSKNSRSLTLQESLESQEDFENFIKSTGLKGMQSHRLLPR